LKAGITPLLVYTYYSRPWKRQTGDEVRIYNIIRDLESITNQNIVVYCLSQLVESPQMTYRRGRVIYIEFPRKFYHAISKILKWKNVYELNPLVKVTHYIDELILVAKLLQNMRRAKIAYVFGSMTLFTFFANIMGAKCIFIYDPLANYAQTLYLRSRKSLVELLKYGLYLAIHRLQVRASHHVIYPSKIDLENAKHMFKPSKVSIVPNPFPICYESLEEYEALRRRRKNFDVPYFILLAGSRGNRETVTITLNIFNNIDSGKFRLFITGPWNDLRKYVRNPSIKILGVVPHLKLKEILAMADYGLSPIFRHAAGTLLKVLAYLAAGLDIVVSPYSLQGIDFSLLKDRRVYVVRNVAEYEAVIRHLTSRGMISENFKSSMRRIVLCREANREVYRSLKVLIDSYMKDNAW